MPLSLPWLLTPSLAGWVSSQGLNHSHVHTPGEGQSSLLRGRSTRCGGGSGIGVPACRGELVRALVGMCLPIYWDEYRGVT